MEFRGGGMCILDASESIVRYYDGPWSSEIPRLNRLERAQTTASSSVVSGAASTQKPEVSARPPPLSLS